MTTLVADVGCSVYEGSMPYALAVAWEVGGAAAWASCVDAEDMGILIDTCDREAVERVRDACRRIVVNVKRDDSPTDAVQVHADLVRDARTARMAAHHAAQAVAQGRARGDEHWIRDLWLPHWRAGNALVCDAIRAVAPCPTLATLAAAMGPR